MPTVVQADAPVVLELSLDRHLDALPESEAVSALVHGVASALAQYATSPALRVLAAQLAQGATLRVSLQAHHARSPH